MTTLVVGSTGATGKLVVERLLHSGIKVRAIARSSEKLQDLISQFEALTVINASISEMSDDELKSQINGCDAVVSCLGHNLTFKGMYGKPRKLVTDGVRRLTNAIVKCNSKNLTKFVLMNTTGNRNQDQNEKISLVEHFVIGIIRILVPPHSDNEQAAEYLRTQIGQDHEKIEWSVVRPDSLINEEIVTDYSIHPSPIRSAIFDSGITSRINVANFISELIINETVWNEWKGKMPVVYNSETKDNTF